MPEAEGCARQSMRVDGSDWLSHGHSLVRDQEDVSAAADYRHSGSELVSMQGGGASCKSRLWECQALPVGQLSGTDEWCEVKDHRHMKQEEPATLDKGPLCSGSKLRCLTDSQPAEELQDFPAHLIDIYKRASEGRLNEERSLIQGVLWDYQDIFSKNEDDLGRNDLVQHAIDTGDTVPLKQHPRRVPSALAHEEEEAIAQLQRQGVI